MVRVLYDKFVFFYSIYWVIIYVWLIMLISFFVISRWCSKNGLVKRLGLKKKGRMGKVNWRKVGIR